MVLAAWLAVSAADQPGPIRHPAPEPEPPPPGPPPPGPGPPGLPPDPTVSLSLSRRSLSFEGVAGSGQSGTAAIGVILYGGNGQRWTARAENAGGVRWLSVSPVIGEDDATLQVTASVGKLPLGNYTGQVSVTVPEATNSPQTVAVSFSVRDTVPASLQMNPTALIFTALGGGEDPAPQQIEIVKQGDAPLNWRVTATTASGGAWLTVTPNAGAERGVLNVRASLAGLAPATYQGVLTIAADGALNSPQQAPVTFTVRRPAPVLRLSAASLSFSSTAEAPLPPAQQVTLSNAGQGSLNWRATVTTFNGGAWLSAGPLEGAGPATVQIGVDASVTPSGTYLGRVLFTAEGAANSPLELPVTLRAERPRPVFSGAAVVNAASLRNTPVAPGGLVSIFGSRLGPRPGVALTLDPATRRLPLELAGVSASFDGVRAPLLYVSDSQINLQAPFELAGKSSARLVLRVPGLDPAEATVPVAPAAPGLFTLDGSRAAALNEDGTLNRPENPASAGSVMQLFLTGQGLLGMAVETGALAPLEPPFPAPAAPVAVSINTIDALVRFAGLAPGLAGLLQLNVQIPERIGASERVMVVVRVGGTASPPAFVALR